MVAEDVHEEFPGRLQPPVDAFKQQRMIANMFHHLDGYHSIKLSFRPKIIDITGDDSKIIQSSSSRFRLNVFSLRVGI